MNGQVLIENERIKDALLLDAQSGTSDGAWVSAGPYGGDDYTISVSGVSGDTMQLRGSNATEQPPAANDGDGQIGGDITANGVYQKETLGSLTKWIKMKKTVGGGTVTARFFGRRPS
jgi:hypothetical protein